MKLNCYTKKVWKLWKKYLVKTINIQQEAI